MELQVGGSGALHPASGPLPGLEDRVCVRGRDAGFPRLERTLARLPATPLDEGVSPWRRGRCHWLAPRAGAIKPGPEHGALTASARLSRCRPRSGKGRISARPSVTPWRTTSECVARGLDALPRGRAVAETWEPSGLGPGKERARGGRGEAWRGARRTRGSGTLGRAGGRGNPAAGRPEQEGTG